MNFDGILEYASKDAELYKLQSDYYKSTASTNYSKAQSRIEASKTKMDALEKELDLVISKFTSLRDSVVEIKTELTEFDDFIASATTTEEIDFYTRKINEIQDKLAKSEKDLALDAAKIDEIGMEYNRSLSIQKQAIVALGEAKIARDELLKEVRTKGMPIKDEMNKLEKTLDRELLARYQEVKNSKTVKYPFIKACSVGSTHCPVCGLELENMQTRNILKTPGVLTTCGSCHRLIFAQ